MDIRISEELNSIISYSREEAMRTGSYGIGPDHLMLGLLRHRDNNAYAVLEGLGADIEQLKAFIDSRVFTNERIPYSELESISFSRGAQNILSLTILEATRHRSPEAGSCHLLLALCRASQSYAQAYLRGTGIDYSRVSLFMDEHGMLRAAARDDEREDESAEDGGERQGARESDPLADFGLDLTASAAAGTLDPVVGRNDETERVIEILGRRKKNNPMLIGEPGVGKSAIVEGIAMRIAAGTAPASISGKRVISLDIASVVAGTKFRGDFEKRMKSIINALKNSPDTILFIDEFHTLVGAGASQGSLDAANMLKPALARGEIQCIGATTMDEFTKIVEKDGALDRRFQKVVVESTGTAQSVAILDRLRPKYEEYHGVSYSAAAIEACVSLSERYVNGRALPDKAIDAMDEAGSMVKLKGRKLVREEDVATVISRTSGIPVNRVAESEGNRLMKMKERLSAGIIGQDSAIETIVNAIQRNRAGLKDPRRPIGSFLFFGPTGVGKTRLAKCLAEYLFDSEDNMVRIDMSEYMEKFTVSRLIGAPPGYVGHEEGGQLSEKVRRKPYCVVLLDEIEKAHPDIFNLLLQIMDDGRLTDSEGRTVNFRNTIIIMTSNVGSREAEEFGIPLGFSTSGRNAGNDRRSIVEKAIKKAFPPEFLNRIDEKVHFRSLGREDIGKIVDIELRSIRKRAAANGYDISVTRSAKEFIADAGYDPAYGARPLKRAVMRYVEDPVSEFIIADRALRIHPGENMRTLKVGMNPEKDGTMVSLREVRPVSTI